MEVEEKEGESICGVMVAVRARVCVHLSTTFSPLARPFFARFGGQAPPVEHEDGVDVRGLQDADAVHEEGDVAGELGAKFGL